MDKTKMAANAVAEEQTIPGQGRESAAAEDRNAAVEANEDLTQTQAFSRRLNEMCGKKAKEAVDAFVASLGQIDPNTGKPVTNEQEMREFLAAQENAGYSRMPDISARVRVLENELASMRMREQENALRNDPELGDLYELYRDEALQLARYAAMNGRAISLEEALHTVMAHNLSAIRRRDAERIRQQEMNRIQANTAASPGAVGGVPIDTRIDYAQMGDSAFEKAIAAAKRGELR